MSVYKTNVYKERKTEVCRYL